MTSKKPEAGHDAFVTAVATTIAKRLMQNVNDVDKRINSWLQQNLSKIILLGMGLTVDAWNEYEPVRSANDSTGTLGLPLISYIQKRAVAEAQRRAPKVIEEIIKKKLDVLDATCRSKLNSTMLELYSGAYSKELRRLVREKLEVNEKVAERMDELIQELKTVFSVFAEAQITSMLKSVTQDDEQR